MSPPKLIRTSQNVLASPQRNSFSASGGLLALGKGQKEFAGGKGPLRAKRAGARESLGRAEGLVTLGLPVFSSR
jgi:hypothetical protein